LSGSLGYHGLASTISKGGEHMAKGKSMQKEKKKPKQKKK
jgi:hypothetical protein